MLHVPLLRRTCCINVLKIPSEFFLSVIKLLNYLSIWDASEEFWGFVTLKGFWVNNKKIYTSIEANGAKINRKLS